METRVIYVDMPARVAATTVMVFDDGDDYPTVVVNSLLSHERQQEGIRHEAKHITGGDFYATDFTVGEIELERHR